MKSLKPTSFSVLIICIVTLVSYQNKAELELLNIAMLYMLPILFAALFLKTFKAALVSFLSVLTFNVLFVPPTFSLTVYDIRYFLSFAIMFSIGILVSILAQKAAKIKELELSEKLSKAVIGSLSHELRTPLAAIVGASSTLMNDELILTEEQKKSLYENISDSSDRMQKMIEALLTEARFAGSIKPVERECDIADITWAVLSKLERIHKKKATFNTSLNLPSSKTDVELLSQAISILIDNAFKYGDNVSVDIHQNESDIEIKITNDGEIPDKDELYKIGEKLCRLSNSKNKEGLGLGIYICKKIVEILGCRLEINIQNNLFCVHLKIPAII